MSPRMSKESRAGTWAMIAAGAVVIVIVALCA